MRCSLTILVRLKTSKRHLAAPLLAQDTGIEFIHEKVYPEMTVEFNIACQINDPASKSMPLTIFHAKELSIRNG